MPSCRGRRQTRTRHCMPREELTDQTTRKTRDRTFPSPVRTGSGSTGVISATHTGRHPVSLHGTLPKPGRPRGAGGPSGTVHLYGSAPSTPGRHGDRYKTGKEAARHRRYRYVDLDRWECQNDQTRPVTRGRRRVGIHGSGAGGARATRYTDAPHEVVPTPLCAHLHTRGLPLCYPAANTATTTLLITG